MGDSPYHNLGSQYAVACIMQDGNIEVFGSEDYGVNQAKNGNEYSSLLTSGNLTQIYSAHNSFVAVKDDKYILTWGDTMGDVTEYEFKIGGVSLPTGVTIKEIIISNIAQQELLVLLSNNSLYKLNLIHNDVTLVADNVSKIATTLPNLGTISYFSAIDEDGNGFGEAGHLSNLRDIYSGEHIFIALNADNKIENTSHIFSDNSTHDLVNHLHNKISEINQIKIKKLYINDFNEENNSSILIVDDNDNIHFQSPMSDNVIEPPSGANMSTIREIVIISGGYIIIKKDLTIDYWGYSNPEFNPYGLFKDDISSLSNIKQVCHNNEGEICFLDILGNITFFSSNSTGPPYAPPSNGGYRKIFCNKYGGWAGLSITAGTLHGWGESGYYPPGRTYNIVDIKEVISGFIGTTVNGDVFYWINNGVGNISNKNNPGEQKMPIFPQSRYYNNGNFVFPQPSPSITLKADTIIATQWEYLHGINAADGTKIFMTKLGGSTNSAGVLVPSNKTILIGDSTGNVYSIYLEDDETRPDGKKQAGDINWSTKAFPDEPESYYDVFNKFIGINPYRIFTDGVLNSDGSTFFVVGAISTNSNGFTSNLCAINPIDGTRKWIVPLSEYGTPYPRPALSSDDATIFICPSSDASPSKILAIDTIAAEAAAAAAALPEGGVLDIIDDIKKLEIISGRFHGPITISPDDTTLLYGDMDKKIHAIYITDEDGRKAADGITDASSAGSVKWTKDISGQANNSEITFSSDGTTIFKGTTMGLSCRNADDGTEKWFRELGVIVSKNGTMPISSDGATIFVGVGGYPPNPDTPWGVHAINTTDGSVIWSFHNVDNYVYAPTSLSSDGTTLFVHSYRNIYALDANTGCLINGWKNNTGIYQSESTLNFYFGKALILPPPPTLSDELLNLLSDTSISTTAVTNANSEIETIAVDADDSAVTTAYTSALQHLSGDSEFVDNLTKEKKRKILKNIMIQIASKLSADKKTFKVEDKTEFLKFVKPTDDTIDLSDKIKDTIEIIKPGSSDIAVDMDNASVYVPLDDGDTQTFVDSITGKEFTMGKSGSDFTLTVADSSGGVHVIPSDFTGVADQEGQVYTYVDNANTRNTTFVWGSGTASTNLQPPLTLEPYNFNLYEESMVIVTGQSGIYAMSIADGSEKWTFKPGSIQFKTTPTFSSDWRTAFVGSSNYDKLYAINTADGTKKWESDTEKIYTRAALSLDDETVFVASVNGKLYAIYTTDEPGRTDVDGNPAPKAGDKKWVFEMLPLTSERPNGFDPTADPTLSPDGATVFIGSLNNYFYAIDASSGTKKWEYDTGGKIKSSPVFSLDGESVIIGNDKKLYDFYISTGQLTSTHQPWVGNQIISLFMNSNKDTLFIITDEIQIYAKSLGLYNGNKNYTVGSIHRWTIFLGGGAYPLVGVSLSPDEMTLIIRRDSKLHAFNTSDGSDKWSVLNLSYSHQGIAPVLSSDSTTIFTENGSQVSAYNITDGTLVDSWGVSGHSVVGSVGTLYGDLKISQSGYYVYEKCVEIPDVDANNNIPRESDNNVQDIVRYEINPDISTYPGLSFDPSNGKITGIPKVDMTFSVTGFTQYDQSSNSVPLTIKVELPSAPVLNGYVNPTPSLISGFASKPIDLSGESTAQKYEISDVSDGPYSGSINISGMNFDVSSGQISGTPTEEFATKTFYVRGYIEDCTDPTSRLATSEPITIDIEIINPLPDVIYNNGDSIELTKCSEMSAENPDLSFNKITAIEQLTDLSKNFADITEFNTDVEASITTYSIDPSINDVTDGIAGLTFDTATGAIGGTPTALTESLINDISLGNLSIDGTDYKILGEHNYNLRSFSTLSGNGKYMYFNGGNDADRKLNELIIYEKINDLWNYKQKINFGIGTGGSIIYPHSVRTDYSGNKLFIIAGPDYWSGDHHNLYFYELSGNQYVKYSGQGDQGDGLIYSNIPFKNGFNAGQMQWNVNSEGTKILIPHNSNLSSYSRMLIVIFLDIWRSGGEFDYSFEYGMVGFPFENSTISDNGNVIVFTQKRNNNGDKFYFKSYTYYDGKNKIENSFDANDSYIDGYNSSSYAGRKLSISHDGKYLVVGDNNGNIMIYELDSNENKWTKIIDWDNSSYLHNPSYAYNYDILIRTIGINKYRIFIISKTKISYYNFNGSIISYIGTFDVPQATGLSSDWLNNYYRENHFSITNDGSTILQGWQTKNERNLWDTVGSGKIFLFKIKPKKDFAITAAATDGQSSLPVNLSIKVDLPPIPVLNGYIDSSAVLFVGGVSEQFDLSAASTDIKYEITDVSGGSYSNSVDVSGITFDVSTGKITVNPIQELPNTTLYVRGYLIDCANPPNKLVESNVVQFDIKVKYELSNLQYINKEDSDNVLSSGDNITFTTGRNVLLDASASNSPTAIDVSGLPLGLTFDSLTGDISGVPTHGGISGEMIVTVTNAGGDAIFNFTYEVNDSTPPTISNLTLTPIEDTKNLKTTVNVDEQCKMYYMLKKTSDNPPDFNEIVHGPFGIKGYYPLYDTSENASNSSLSDSSEVEVINIDGEYYYMPKTGITGPVGYGYDETLGEEPTEHINERYVDIVQNYTNEPSSEHTFTNTLSNISYKVYAVAIDNVDLSSNILESTTTSNTHKLYGKFNISNYLPSGLSFDNLTGKIKGLVNYATNNKVTTELSFMNTAPDKEIPTDIGIRIKDNFIEIFIKSNVSIYFNNVSLSIKDHLDVPITNTNIIESEWATGTLLDSTSYSAVPLGDGGLLIQPIPSENLNSLNIDSWNKIAKLNSSYQYGIIAPYSEIDDSVVNTLLMQPLNNSLDPTGSESFQNSNITFS